MKKLLWNFAVLVFAYSGLEQFEKSLQNIHQEYPDKPVFASEGVENIKGTKVYGSGVH
jgi:hypothetical protein